MLTKNLSSVKHSGVRSLLNKNFVTTEIIPHDDAKLYNELFDNRQESDYDDFIDFTLEEIEKKIPSVRKFLDNIRNELRDWI